MTSRRFCPPLSPSPVTPPTTVSATSSRPLYVCVRNKRINIIIHMYSVDIKYSLQGN